MPRESFQSTEVLLGFYETACKAGVIEQSENAELRFIAFAERARFRATSSPGDFLRRLVEGKLVEHISEGQWEAANGSTGESDLVKLTQTSAITSGVFQEVSGNSNPKRPDTGNVLCQIQAREEAEAARSARVEKYLQALSAEDRQRLEDEALAQGQPFLVRELERCRREKNE
jgi:hypothetical protein